jgi:acyl-CoA oxidase
LDRATDEWIINTPNEGATKYWPGDLGRFTTHGCVFARCIIDGKDYGVQPFVVQYRDTKTFQRVKGFESGDLGPKFGYETRDTSWATFDHVRIPRTNMLMKVCQVDKDGKFTQKGDPREMYTTMMLVRLTIIFECANFSLIALKIALRYACVRR